MSWSIQKVILKFSTYFFMKYLLFIKELFLSDIKFSQLQQYNCHPNDTAILLFSSGTTGLAKGVQLSHNNLTAHSEQSKAKIPFEPMLKAANTDYQEVLLSVLPFFHVFGLTVLMLSKMAIGAKNITLPRFQPDVFVKALKEYQPTLLPLAPSMGEKRLS